MKPPSYSPEVLKRARTEKRHLFKAALSGHHAGEPSIGISADLNPTQAKAVVLFLSKLLVEAEAESKPKPRLVPDAEPVCSVCRDTHLMPWTTDSGDKTTAMCTRCPVPCQLCRQGGNGPYCESTPCDCNCHETSQ